MGTLPTQTWMEKPIFCQFPASSKPKTPRRIRAPVNLYFRIAKPPFWTPLLLTDTQAFKARPATVRSNAKSSQRLVAHRNSSPPKDLCAASLQKTSHSETSEILLGKKVLSKLGKNISHSSDKRSQSRLCKSYVHSCSDTRMYSYRSNDFISNLWMVLNAWQICLQNIKNISTEYCLFMSKIWVQCRKTVWCIKSERNYPKFIYIPSEPRKWPRNISIVSTSLFEQR